MYKQAIQRAFKDVSDALIQYEQYHQVRTAQEVTVKDLEDSLTTSMKRYRGGIATYLEVLDNQRLVVQRTAHHRAGPRQ